MSRTRRLLGAAGLAAILGLAGCVGGDGRDGTARDGGSIVVGAEVLPATLDPALAADPLALQVLWQVHTPLLIYPHVAGGEGLEPAPGLARARPKVSADGLTYTLWLRRGLRYSNGVPVRAGDFERTIARLRALNSPLAPLYAGIAGVDAEAETGRIDITLTGRDPALRPRARAALERAAAARHPDPRPDPAAAGGQRPLPDPGHSRAGESGAHANREQQRPRGPHRDHARRPAGRADARGARAGRST